jgi:hypothetical protein
MYMGMEDGSSQIFFCGIVGKERHYFSQESITSPCKSNIMSQSKEIVDAWLDMSEKLAEHEDLLSWSEHLMYVGRKL